MLKNLEAHEYQRIPAQLTQYFIKMCRSFPPGADFEFFGAGLILKHFCNINVLDSLQKPFLEASVDGEFTFRLSTRVKHIGDTLIQLTGSQSLPEICRRIRERGLKSPFFEAFSAAMLVDEGFEVRAVSETGVRGRDFDFAALRDGLVLNAEVSALEATTEPETTLRNALHTKRKQLPTDAAAVIFIAVPDDWFSLVNLEESFKKVGFEFLRQTKRVNYIVFLIERFVITDEVNGRGELIIAPLVLVNDNARHRCDLLFAGLLRDGARYYSSRPPTLFNRWVSGCMEASREPIGPIRAPRRTTRGTAS